ncbi:Gpi16 [Kluyveromyces lactis]|nr:Gpi16 [Kluyveromyces lactis]
MRLQNWIPVLLLAAIVTAEVDFEVNSVYNETESVQQDVIDESWNAEPEESSRITRSSKFLSLEHPIQYNFREHLDLTPLPNNFLLASFQFYMQSEQFGIDRDQHESSEYSHHTVFPKPVGPIMSQTNTRQLHLRFTHGLWDSQEWGQLPHNGLKSGGTGVELWAIMEAPSKEEALKSWITLANSLSGLFCASINFIDTSKTTFPVSSFLPKEDEAIPLLNQSNHLYLMRATLANEPVCTENLTPFVKLLPTRGKSGISSLLDGHKIFDSNWHSLSIDVNTVCDESTANCHFVMEEFIETVVNVPNALARADRPIPKPLPGDELRCDTNRPHDAFQCFPLPQSKEVSFSISKLFGKKIRGGSLLGEQSSKICVHVPSHWDVMIQVDESYFATDDNCFDLNNNKPHDVRLETSDSKSVLSSKKTPIYVSRALTGYGQDRGGLRSVFRNPSNESVELVYFESLPWFMGVYLSSLAIESDDPKLTLDSVVKSTFYSPARDRERPTHLERTMIIPPNTAFAISFQFDKSLLKYAEYPPDANHGFEIEAAVAAVLTPEHYEARTSSLLLSLSTPDFSMPYNVIILTSTVMGLAFGTLFNLISKQLITLEEADKILASTGPRAKLLRVKAKIVSMLQGNKNKIIKSAKNE